MFSQRGMSPEGQQRGKGRQREGRPGNAIRFFRVSLTGLLSFTCLICTTTVALAATPAAYTVSVPVVDVEPILTSRTVEHPIQQCRTEEVVVDHGSRYHDHDRRRHNYDGPNTFVPGILGGLFGGLIGNQFGGGSGKKALTVIGALAGSSIARQNARNRHGVESRDRRDHYYGSEPRRVCTTRYETELVEEVTGYDVTYEYGGQYFNKRTAEHPGDQLRVRVEVSAAPDNHRRSNP